MTASNAASSAASGETAAASAWGPAAGEPVPQPAGAPRTAGGTHFMQARVSEDGVGPVEEVDLTGLEVVLGPHHAQAVALDALLEHARAVAQVIGRDPHVGPHRLAQQG